MINVLNDYHYCLLLLLMVDRLFLNSNKHIAIVVEMTFFDHRQYISRLS